MLTRLTEFLEKSDIIYKGQFGFLKNKSATHAVFDLYARFADVLNKGNYASSVFKFCKGISNCQPHNNAFKIGRYWY